MQPAGDREALDDSDPLGAGLGGGEQAVSYAYRDHPFILPIAGKSALFSIAGIPCTGDQYGLRR